MFRRNRNPPPLNTHQQPQNNIIQRNQLIRQQAQSPQTYVSRLERKPAEQNSPKSSSLTNKLKTRAFNPLSPPSNTVTKSPAFKSSQFEINNDYYPQLPSHRVPNTFTKSSFSTHQDLARPVRGRLREEPRSDTDLPSYISDTDKKAEQESVSTQMSKQDSKQNLKEVKFGGVIQQNNQNAFNKKKLKARSPSILKNGRILNGSIILADKSRSCSVASGKERREKQKYKNQHNINHIIKQKYKSILNRLQTEYHGKSFKQGGKFSAATYGSQRTQIPSPYKYNDDIFPPVYSSLFCLKKSRSKPGIDISWMRLSNLFQGRPLVLAKPNYTNLQIYRTDDSYSEDYLPGSLNCLLGSPKLLQRMFQDQTVNQFGVYLVKIYQESIWKYIIIDDYIPVKKNKEGNMEPAFLNVRVPKDGPVDLWPFLVEKAYANYYASYEALNHGNILDFVEEVTGSPSERVKLKGETRRKDDKMNHEQMQTALTKVSKILKSGSTLAVGQISNDKGYAPITFNTLTSQLLWNDPFCQFQQRKISFESLKDTFRTIHIISPFKYSQCTITPLRKGRAKHKKYLNPYFQINPPSIRSFIVQQSGDFSISIKQRDKRFFHFKHDHGGYIWIRAILLQKEYQNTGYRWINGLYSQEKTINFAQILQPGQYWLVIEPEWQLQSANQLIIQIQGPTQLQISRQIYRQEARILQSGCLDLAQRYGQLNQINKFICSYNFVSQSLGYIIQNIINERVNGNVSVIRSIRGLKCKSQILPVNGQFYQRVMKDGEEVFKLNQEIQLDIPEGQQYTVVLKIKGGIDVKFFRTFDFGC